jgi:hypothetical protein
MTKVSSLLCAFFLACGDPDDALVSEEGEANAQATAVFETQLSERASVDAKTTEVPFARALEDCYAETLARGRRVEVHTIGRYLALGDTMMAVRVAIPSAPTLARCIEEAVSQSVPPGASEAPDALASGSFAIDLGGPPPPVQIADIARQYEAHRKGMAALMREVVALGLLPQDHPLVQEALQEEGAHGAQRSTPDQ